MRFPPGTRLGHYEIRSQIGAGGMGEVYLGEDELLRRKVAIKVLPDTLTADPRAEKRMLQEARAAATLDHPNICSIYEVSESGGFLFIAMQFIEGEPLDEKIRRNDLGTSLVLNVAIQLADALTEAHSKGLIHRDIKPANVMITPRGDAKLMDFGLVKLELTRREVESEAETAALLSTPGHIIGTVPYMSPEQVKGRPVDARSDLFSLGIVIYEMLSGQRPFKGESTAETGSAILTYDPPPLTRFVKELPGELQRIVDKLLHKDADDRYQTARDLLIDLRTLRDDLDFRHRLERSDTPGLSVGKATDGFAPAAARTEILPIERTVGQRQNTNEAAITTAGAPSATVRYKLWIAGMAVALLLGLGGWWLWQRANVSWAKDQLGRVEELSSAGDNFAAFDLAMEVQKYIPNDATLGALLPGISDTLSVTTNPSGARAYLRRYDADDAGAYPDKQFIGTTPLTDVRIARGPHILSVEKEGFSPTERSFSGRVVRNGTMAITSPPVKVEFALMTIDAVPAKMVPVPGGDYRLVAWERPTENRIKLNDYFIDKYEVSNADYKEFINAGGYSKKQFWQVPFVKDGKQLTWEDGIALLKDRTGLPGPRSWSSQEFPAGKADHPVTDITLYEAAAYATFRGKTLPTIFQWEKAARNGQVLPFGTFMPWGYFSPGDSMKQRANFETTGTHPVTGSEFGMSPFGAYNMAGNVSEWTLNETTTGFIATGGGWGDPVYTFAQFGVSPAFFSSEKRGFRCVLNTPGEGDQGASKIDQRDVVPEFTPTSETEVAKLAERYRYENLALDPTVDEVIETPEWRRERISFNGAGGERAWAYLYLPKNFARPLQVIHFIPAGDVENGWRSLTASAEDRLAPHIKSGRAVFGVITKGYSERLWPEGFVRPDRNTAEYRDIIVHRITDVRRGLDYLVTRNDIDPKRIAFFGPSAGSRIGLILAALEGRYAGVFFMGAGLGKPEFLTMGEVNPVNFAPHIRGPKYILNGRYDEDTPLKTHCEPLFKLLREPKKLEVYDGGHVPSTEIFVPSLNKFLDETLGPVKVG